MLTSLLICIVAGSFSRTAVNYAAGCESLISNIVMAITVMISLQFLTNLLYYTPIAIIASVILSALPGLIDITEAYKIWKVDKLDFLACIGAFFGVLFASVEIGLLVAVIISQFLTWLHYETIHEQKFRMRSRIIKIVFESMQDTLHTKPCQKGDNVSVYLWSQRHYEWITRNFVLYYLSVCFDISKLGNFNSIIHINSLVMACVYTLIFHVLYYKVRLLFSTTLQEQHFWH